MPQITIYLGWLYGINMEHSHLHRKPTRSSVSQEDMIKWSFSLASSTANSDASLNVVRIRKPVASNTKTPK